MRELYIFIRYVNQTKKQHTRRINAVTGKRSNTAMYDKAVRCNKEVAVIYFKILTLPEGSLADRNIGQKIIE